MNATSVALSTVQHDAVAAPLEGACIAIAGPAGSGKSVTLARRAGRAIAMLQPGERIILSAASELSVVWMRSHFGAAATHPQTDCRLLADIAFDIVQRQRREAHEPPFAPIDDVVAEELLSFAGTSLFALEWEELLSAELDPEITGMRAPRRFAATAYRLIRKLRMAGISPEEFLSAALRGATSFYGNPPNFANPDLIEKTPPKYRDSLRVDRTELQHQHTREVDLSKVLERLYRTYLTCSAERGWLTRIGALDAATRLLEAQPEVRAALCREYRFAFVDDAQDLALCDARFLSALFGADLHGVTFAGDDEQRTRAFSGPRADNILEKGRRFVLVDQWRSAAPIVEVARAIVAPRSRTVVHAPQRAVEAVRTDSVRAEAAYVADGVAQALAEGVAPGDIAIIARSLRCTDAFMSALLDRNIPVDPAGEGSLYAFADVEDCLAPLWALADPYRHDWLLRNLAAPWLRLSDASIAMLCAEPADTQALLFELPADAAGETDRRWDRRRDFRLAWNVLRGDRDIDLGPQARARLEAFRAARREWLADERRLPVGVLARRVLDATVYDAGAGARPRLRRALAGRLLAQIDRFAASRPRATLHDFLLHVELVRSFDDDLLVVEPFDADAVAVLGVEAGKGREFARVFIVDLKAGAFPRYYVPDSFQFTPRFGMIPKENVGEGAACARTAKFTYFQYKLDLRNRYYAEERRALYSAASRARERLSFSASGRATKGVGAPEWLEEIRAVL